MKKEKKEELLFVKMGDLSNVKRKILESSKEIIECLKKYENLKSVRKEKLKNIMKLKEDTKEVINLISKLKSALPKTSIKIKGVKKEVIQPQPEIPEAKDIKPEIEIEKPTTEIERLEAELSDIESKLNALS